MSFFSQVNSGKINQLSASLAQKAQQADLNTTNTNVTNQQYFVSTKSFPRNTGETDDAPRIMRTINSLTSGGVVQLEATTYTVASTLTIPQNITLRGQGYGKWTAGTSLHYIGTGACINFASTGNADGIILENFKIYANSGDVSYHNFTGIDVNCAELMTIRNVLIQYANIGIKCSATTSYIYLLNIDNIFIYNCLNEGILVPVPSGSNWSNGIRIKVGDISSNNIGIHVLAGQGNTIEGDASEVGSNTTGGILIEGGVWSIKGNLWIENSPYGIQTTGGHTSVFDDVYCVAPINQIGGTLYIPNKHAVVNRISQSMIKRGLASWFSFEEGVGNTTYDRTAFLKGTISGTPTWNGDTGKFGSTITIPAGNSTSLPLNMIDWTQDWTFLYLGNGANSNNFLYVRGSDGTKSTSFYSYPNGTQVYQNSVFKANLATFPNGDATLNNNWHIVSYKASTTTFTAYNQAGRPMATYVMTIDPTLANPNLISIGNGHTTDEFVLYSRILTDSEIRAICEMSIIPDVNTQQNKASSKVSDMQITSTSATTVSTLTPVAQGNFEVKVYYRVITASTNLGITITFTDGSGTLQTYNLVPNASQPVGSGSVKYFFNATSASAITVTATPGTANQVYVSASIMPE